MQNFGMLWFDNTKTSLQIKLDLAVSSYKKKYGITPDICYLHPSMLDGNGPVLNKIDLIPSISIIPFHFWLDKIETGEKNFSKSKN